MTTLPTTPAQIDLTDTTVDSECVSERFCDGRLTVVSRSGLSVTEAHLTEALSFLSRSSRLLILGNRTGALAMMAARGNPATEIAVSSLDLFHHHAVERNLARNRAAGITARCEPDVAERDYYDAVCLQASKGAFSDELLQDLLQQSHLALKLGGKCFATVEEDAPRWSEHIRKTFGGCSVQGHRQDSTLLIGQKKKDLAKPKVFRAEFVMTLPRGEPVTLATVPGVFAHRRVDSGAQALAEVVRTEPGDAILDMGCGCGSVGIALARNEPTASVCFVDSFARAVALAAENCRANGIANYSTVLSDQGLPPEPRFTLFVGNPPYYSNDRIADLFMRTAQTTLRSGGRAYLVAKNVNHHAEFMTELFGRVEILSRRGYKIVKAVKP